MHGEDGCNNSQDRYAAIEPGTPITQPRDHGQRRGDGNQAGSSKREDDSLRDDHGEDAKHHDSGPAPGVDCQPDCEREGNLQKHRRDRRILKRAARADLGSRERNPGPEQGEKPEGWFEGKILEHRENSDPGACGRRGDEDGPQPSRGEDAVDGKQVHSECQSEAPDHIEGVVPVRGRCQRGGKHRADDEQPG